ncbi:MAG: hypothetical protein ACLRRA_07850 [Acutalibacteraceae bacterium]
MPLRRTNYDLACGGVNACLAERLQLKQISMLRIRAFGLSGFFDWSAGDRDEIV